MIDFVAKVKYTATHEKCHLASMRKATTNVRPKVKTVLTVFPFAFTYKNSQ